jgi:hypothetical protein
MTESMDHLDPIEPKPPKRRRPVLTTFGGLFLGLGIALLLFTYAKIAFGTMAFPLVILIGIVVGLLLGLFAPARRSRRT